MSKAHAARKAAPVSNILNLTNHLALLEDALDVIDINSDLAAQVAWAGQNPSRRLQTVRALLKPVLGAVSDAKAALANVHSTYNLRLAEPVKEGAA